MIELNKKQEEFLYRLIDIEKDTNRFNSYIIDLIDSKSPYIEYMMLIELGKAGMIEYAQYGEDLIIGDITSVGLSYKDCKKEKEMQVKREHSLKKNAQLLVLFSAVQLHLFLQILSLYHPLFFLYFNNPKICKNIKTDIQATDISNHSLLPTLVRS